MLIYAGATALSMFFAAAAMKIKNGEGPKRGYLFFCVASFLPLTLVSALRYRVGTDWPIYENFFHSINTGGEKFSEIGFNFINRIAYWIAPDLAVLVAIISVLTCFFVFLAIYKQSVNVVFSILLFVICGDYFNSLNQIRQTLAMGIVLYALGFIWKRKPVSYIIWILVAASIHTSALIFLPAYLLYKRKMDLKINLIIFIGCAALYPALSRLLVFMTLHTRYAWYIGSVYDIQNFYVLGFIFMLILMVLYFYYYYVGGSDDYQYNLMTNLLFFSVLLLLFSSVLPQIQRLSSFLTCVNCLNMARLVHHEKIPHRRVVLYILVTILFAGKLLYDIYVNQWYGAIPYQTIFIR